MPVIPPNTLDQSDRPINCQEALTADICAIADQAVALGWDKEEITVALMEIANSWYLAQAAAGNAPAQALRSSRWRH